MPSGLFPNSSRDPRATRRKTISLLSFSMTATSMALRIQFGQNVLLAPVQKPRVLARSSNPPGEASVPGCPSACRRALWRRLHYSLLAHLTENKMAKRLIPLLDRVLVEKNCRTHQVRRRHPAARVKPVSKVRVARGASSGSCISCSPRAPSASTASTASTEDPCPLNRRSNWAQRKVGSGGVSGEAQARKRPHPHGYARGRP